MGGTGLRAHSGPPHRTVELAETSHRRKQKPDSGGTAGWAGFVPDPWPSGHVGEISSAIVALGARYNCHCFNGI